ncbi:hypothetical protein BGX38DRAFT_548402 [Terfezia claveryi]|nr:hypothetical protein BGX38DRAFT_548402 [Terfezia claveryi]
MSPERCTNCDKLRCKGKCIVRASGQRSVPPATTTSNQPHALASERGLNISIQTNTGNSASYPSSFQSTTQVNATTDDRVNEWLTQNRGIPFEYQYNSFQQPNTSTPAKQHFLSTSTKYQCPHCRKHNRDNSKLKDHLKSHLPNKTEVCPDCFSRYKFKRDLVDHRRNRCKFRVESTAQSTAEDPHSPPRHQSQNSRQSQYTPQNQNRFPTSTSSLSVPLGLDETAQQMFDNRRGELEDVISNATQVQQQLDEVYRLLWREHLGRDEPDTFSEMLGEGSEFESCDYSIAPDVAKDGGPSAEGKLE